MLVRMRSPLLLNGGPAAGKSATSLELARSFPRAAVFDVDDVRHLVVSSRAAPWDGQEGRTQQQIGVANACDIAQRVHKEGIEVVKSDVVTAATIKLYRRLLADVVIVQLRLPLHEARRRATLRAVHLTDEEFESLHIQQAANLAVDYRLDVGDMTLQLQTMAVLRLWDP